MDGTVSRTILVALALCGLLIVASMRGNPNLETKPRLREECAGEVLR